MCLSIESLYFAYAGKSRHWIIADFDLAVDKGEVVGISGPSGQGKSTLLRLIAGLELPQEGRITIAGRTVFDRNVNLAPELRQVGMVFQDYGLFPHMTVAGNVAYGLHRLPRAERKKRVAAMLELVRMDDLADRYPYAVSGGQQQRIALARALAPAPQVLLLDEPFSNLDAELKTNIREEVRAILAQTRTSCLFVSHDRADLEAVCGRIVDMEFSASPQ